MASAGGPIEVRRHGGRGPVVAVLHGGPGAPGSAASLARDLAEAFSVLEPLQRRAGETPLTVARHVDDLAGVLPEGAALVGHSWGAMLALSCAAAHPGSVRSLALVGCGTYDPADRVDYERGLAARLGKPGRRQAARLRRRLERHRGAQSDAAWAALGRLMERAQSFDLLEGEADPVEVDRRGHDETWADALRLQREGIEPAAFAAITCPVLMLHGDDDPHPGRATFEHLRRFMPRLQYRGFPRCGHRPWAERHARDPFLAALREWLGEGGAAGR